MIHDFTFEDNPQIYLAKKLIFESNESLFLTGNAGTGKTTFLLDLISHCPKIKVVLAPTGVAAINVKGTTIHSFFNLPFAPFNPTMQYSNNQEEIGQNQLLSRLRYNTEKRALLRSLELLIIDEISMVRADVIDAIDYILRHYRNQRHLPFGGCQVLFVGDLFQLPPIAENQTWSILSRFYRSVYFYDSQVISQYPLQKIQLEKIYRQKDIQFIQLLNAIRNNELEADQIETLNQQSKPIDDDKLPITLCTHRNAADMINDQELSKINQPRFVYSAYIQGDFRESAYPMDSQLVLKEGSQVMFIKNDMNTPRRYFNGKIGVVDRLTEDEIFVRLTNDVSQTEEVIKVSRDIWTQYEYKFDIAHNKVIETEVGTFEHFPIKLAWAITIHKSQGLTFEYVKLDVRDSFVSGQTYVALSRCRTLEGIQMLTPYPKMPLRYPEHLVSYASDIASIRYLKNFVEQQRPEYLKIQILRMFDIEKIFDTLQDLEELFYEYQEKLKNAEGYILEIQKLKNKYTEIDQTNFTFLKQIQHQNENEDLNGFENWLRQRIPKAFDFYATFIVSNFLDKLYEYQSQIALFYGVTPLRKELDLLIKNIESIVFKFEKIQNLSIGLEFDANLYIKQKKQVTKNSPKSKVSTTQITLDLIQEGKRIGEIAAIRNLTEATIFTHFTKLFEQQLITKDQMLDKEVQKQLEQICEQLPENADFAFIQKQNYPFDYKYISFWRSYRSKKEVVKS